MGLTKDSVGLAAVDGGLAIRKESPLDRVVAIAGNPNVGKSTLFNALTGMRQHTGNWPGKTVTTAQGAFRSKRHGYVLVDIPGTYSLMAHSAEEEVARDFLCFGGAEAAVVVCDATCLERNCNLVLQTLEISDRVLVCVNLMDEAKRKHIRVDLAALSERLGVPVVGTSARRRKSLAQLIERLDEVVDGEVQKDRFTVRYPDAVEEAVLLLEPAVKACVGERVNARWLSLRLLEGDESLLRSLRAALGEDILSNEALARALEEAGRRLAAEGITADRLKDLIVSSLVRSAEEISRSAVSCERRDYDARDRRIDRVLTSRWGGYPVMLAFLALIFWLTISGANLPSQLLSDVLFRLQDRLTELFVLLHAPDWLCGVLVLGVYRTLAWVVSVMLPPMAIFFPLFTLLEDAGYLPRVAYNLDRPFRRCRACGKQALTM